jgi:hypothetical protein
MNVIIRRAQTVDEPLIYSTWSKNRWHSEAKKQTPPPNKAAWFKAKFAEIKEALQSHNIRVACPADEPNLIIGYAAIRDGEVIWSYVKQDYRNEGIENLLTNKPGESK